jgi:hypothetical protein
MEGWFRLAEREDSEVAVMEQGRQVGEFARELFPGVLVQAASLAEAIRITHNLLARRPDLSTIFEGAFEYGGVYVRVDILRRCRNGRYRLIEVKSSAHVKDEYLPDVAIQAYVVSHSGFDLPPAFWPTSIGVTHIRRCHRSMEVLQHQECDPADRGTPVEAFISVGIRIANSQHAGTP